MSENKMSGGPPPAGEPLSNEAMTQIQRDLYEMRRTFLVRQLEDVEEAENRAETPISPQVARDLRSQALETFMERTSPEAMRAALTQSVSAHMAKMHHLRGDTLETDAQNAEVVQVLQAYDNSSEAGLWNMEYQTLREVDAQTYAPVDLESVTERIQANAQKASETVRRTAGKDPDPAGMADDSQGFLKRMRAGVQRTARMLVRARDLSMATFVNPIVDRFLAKPAVSVRERVLAGDLKGAQGAAFSATPEEIKRVAQLEEKLKAQTFERGLDQQLKKAGLRELVRSGNLDLAQARAPDVSREQLEHAARLEKRLIRQREQQVMDRMFQKEWAKKTVETYGTTSDRSADIHPLDAYRGKLSGFNDTAHGDPGSSPAGAAIPERKRETNANASTPSSPAIPRKP